MEGGSKRLRLDATVRVKAPDLGSVGSCRFYGLAHVRSSRSAVTLRGDGNG
jgi:hypothetical protein